MEDKSTGTFYTPELLVKYMVDYSKQKSNPRNVLEPSIGDGRFIHELQKHEYSIKGTEIDRNKINTMAAVNSDKVDIECVDFIDYAITTSDKYDLIIGNPPYIKKKNILEEQKNKSCEIARDLNLPEDIVQNLWVSFVLGSVRLLNTYGSIYFILPFEFLQVQYAEKLRSYLETKFNYIEITTFNESVFPQIEQDVCLVYMSNIPDIIPIIKYSTVNNIHDMKSVYYSEICRNKPLRKWSNAILDDNETELLIGLQEKYIKISELGDISPGIVTGANNFFIINTSKVQDFDCMNLVIPIIQRSSLISNILRFEESDMKKLKDAHKAVWMLNLTNVEEDIFSNKLKEYLRSATERENDKLNDRYKCKKRSRWYDVPLIKNGSLMFFRRYNKLPKIVINSADVYTIDNAYNIRLNDKYDPDSVAFCFYNSLTLTLCEYYGRFYGGGVGELVPSEFKSISLPYKLIDAKDVDTLDKMFRNNTPSKEIIDFVDSIIFSELNKDQIKKLRGIRSKYLSRRIKE